MNCSFEFTFKPLEVLPQCNYSKNSLICATLPLFDICTF